MLNLKAYGILYLAMEKPIAVSDALEMGADQDDIDLLVKKKLVVVEGGSICLVISGEVEAKEKFDFWRKEYPQKPKPGLEAAWQMFKRKCRTLKLNSVHETEKLMPALEAEKAERAQKYASGRYVPEWKNLDTYINKAMWTGWDENPMEPIRIDERYIKYLNWYKNAYGSIDGREEMAMSQDQYLNYINGTGNFSGKKFTEDRKRVAFIAAHDQVLIKKAGQSIYATLLNILT